MTQYNLTYGPVVDDYVTFKATLWGTDVTEACVTLMNADQAQQRESHHDTACKFEMQDGFGRVENDGDSPFGLGDIADYLSSVLRLPLTYEGDDVDEAIDGGVR